MNHLMDEIVDTEGVPVDVIDDNATAILHAPDGPASQARELVRVGRLPQIGDVAGRKFVPSWGWIFKDEWVRMEDFQAPMPPLPPNFPRHIIAEALAATKKWNEVPWAAEVERKMKLNPSASVRWEFDALASDKQTWHVDTAVLGSETFVQWTWGDAYVVAPVLRFFCAITNFFSPIFVKKIRIPTS